MFGGEIERLQSEKQAPAGGPGWLSRVLLGLSAIALVAGLAVGVIALLFARGDPVVSRRIVTFISTSIGSDSTRLESDRIHGSIFGGAVLEHPRLVVLTPDGPVTWLSADRLRAEYETYQVLFSHRRSLRITIDNPVLPLVHDKHGNLVVPRFRGSKRNPLDRTATRIDVTFRGGTISLDRGGVRFGAIGGNAIALLEPNKTTFRVSRLSGTSQMPGRPGTIRANGVATIEGGRLKFDPLYVNLSHSRVRSSIEWDLEHARVVSSRTGLAPLDVAEVMRLLDIEPVTQGTLTGDVTFAGDPASGSAVIRLSGTMQHEPVDTLFIRAALVPGQIHIDELRTRIRDAEVDGRALLETRGVLTAEVHMDHVDPALLPWVHLPASTPHGSLAGTMRIRAVRAKPYPVSAISVVLDRGSLGRLAIQRGSIQMRLGQRGDVAVDTAWVDTPGARLFGAGTLSPDTTLSFRFDASVHDIGAMDALLKPVAMETGQGRVTGWIRGRASAPDYQMQGWLAAGSLSNGMAFDSLRVSSRGRLSSPPAAAADVTVSRLRIGQRPLGDLATSLTWTDHISIDRFRDVLGDTALTMHGNVRFRDKVAEATLDSVAFAVGPHAWRNMGPVQASLEGDRIDIRRLSLAADPGQIDIGGNVRLEKGVINARAVFSQVDLSRLAGRPDAANAPRGVADGDLLVSGGLADPEVQANLRVSHPRLSGIDGDSLAMALAYAPGQLTINDLRWVRGSGVATMTGTARPEITMQEWMRALTRDDHAWSSRVGLALQVQAAGFDLANLAAIDTSLNSLHGLATGSIRITGSAEDPVLALRARANRFSFHGVEAESVDAAGTYAKKRLALDHLDFTRGSSTSHVEGFIPVDLSLYGSHRALREDPVSLKLRMADADFGVAALFIPQLATSAGKLNVTADLHGSLARPVLTGALRLVDGVVRVAGRDEVLEKAEVDASFDEHRVNFTRIAAVEGKRGKLTGTGWWQSAERKHWGDYEFKLHAAEFTATDRETYLFRFTGDFLVQDAVTPDGAETYRITSVTPATLERGELTMDLSQPREDADQPVPFLYQIVVDVPRNLWYRNLDTEVELMNGQMTLQNEGYRDIILGSLDVKGKYYIYSNEFRIVNGTITFTSLDKIDPDISIEAQTTVRGQPQARTAAAGGSNGDEWQIYQTLSGRSSQLKVHLHDDQGSGENYLWKILTIGQFLPAGEAGTTVASPSTPDATLPVRNYLFRNAERWLADVGFIDTIDLKSGAASSGATGNQTIGLLGVGKYVTPELYVKYSRDFSITAEQAQSLSAEYRVTRHLLLRGEQYRTGPGNTAMSSSGPVGSNKPGYNLDLKVRLEY